MQLLLEFPFPYFIIAFNSLLNYLPVSISTDFHLRFPITIPYLFSRSFSLTDIIILDFKYDYAQNKLLSEVFSWFSSIPEREYRNPSRDAGIESNLLVVGSNSVSTRHPDKYFQYFLHLYQENARMVLTQTF